ncbi:uncharacterized protein LOC121728172 [Aricia agestis]|uniref:uncharacterized protein LOC121728172 n=1 Tax=Aricia agestis TaxID=91739 RepID=UPI001C208845|nr:uncharacterized protein LOC121728172 [Aricia agestis]
MIYRSPDPFYEGSSTEISTLCRREALLKTATSGNPDAEEIAAGENYGRTRSNPLKTSDDQKYRYLLQQLQQADLEHITDILYDPTPSKKYENVKQRLLETYDTSDVKNFQKLVSGLELGDLKPSQLMRKMKELASGMITDEGLRIEWMNRLPAQVRVILSINKESSLETLAAMADKMVEYAEGPSVAAVTATCPAPAPSTSSTPEPSYMETLARQIEKLSLEVAELRRGRSHYRNRRRRSFSRPRSRSHSRRRGPRPEQEDSWECHYHYTFGDKSKELRIPVSPQKQEEFGKLTPTPTVADVDVSRTSHRLCVFDRDTRERFLVDTGADISVLAATQLRKKKRTEETYKLYAANNTSIKTYGEETIKLNQDEDSHKKLLRQVLECLDQNGITLNIEKCEFGKNKINFLGYEVSADGI